MKSDNDLISASLVKRSREISYRNVTVGIGAENLGV